MPFETFSKEEVERLVEQVLTAKAQGVSVRACVQQLAGGDRTRCCAIRTNIGLRCGRGRNWFVA